MLNRVHTFGLSAVLALSVMSGALAQSVSQAFTYQGFLRHGGNPANGNYTMTFRIYDALTGGALLWNSGALTVNVNNGLFTVQLNAPASVWSGADRWLEIQVGSTTLSPRVKINPTPYANTSTLINMFQSGTSNPDRMVITHSPALTNWGLQYRDNDDSFHFLGNGVSRLSINLDTGNVGIGTNSPAYLFDVRGDRNARLMNITNTNAGAAADGLHITVSSSSGRGLNSTANGANGVAVYGEATATSGYTFGVVGESDSTEGRGVYGRATASSGDTYGVYGRSDSTSGRGVFGLASATSGDTYGVYGLSHSTEGLGVYGRATASSGDTYGVYGLSHSTAGRGVYGHAGATSGTTFGGEFRSDSTAGKGVFGFASATSGTTYGGYFKSYSTAGRGVFGWVTATSGTTFGGEFKSHSTDGMGVFGSAIATSGTTYGVYGQSASTSGTGVFGSAIATSGTTYGVYGRSLSTDGRGVFGWAYATSGGAVGVAGTTRSNASNAHGVYGSEPSGGAGHAVYAAGTLAATGTKSFQIDHPLMPETHYLNHFCTEAPEPLNAYSGNVVTDAQGYATIQLPDYFESINRDFRYQLTVIDGSDDFVLAKVVREIQNNRFVIRTNKPFVKVSWRVEAIRNDLYLQRYGYQTEQEKEDAIKGKYLHPELYDQPKERGIHYRPEPERPTEMEKP